MRKAFEVGAFVITILFEDDTVPMIGVGFVTHYTLDHDIACEFVNRVMRDGYERPNGKHIHMKDGSMLAFAVDRRQQGLHALDDYAADALPIT